MLLGELVLLGEVTYNDEIVVRKSVCVHACVPSSELQLALRSCSNVAKLLSQSYISAHSHEKNAWHGSAHLLVLKSLPDLLRSLHAEGLGVESKVMLPLAILLRLAVCLASGVRLVVCLVRLATRRVRRAILV